MLTKVHHFYAGQQILRDPFGTCRIILQALHDFCFTGRHSGKVTVKTQNAKRRRKKAKSVTTVDPVFSEQLLRRQIQRVNRFLNNESLVIMIIWVQQCWLSCAVWIVKQPRDNTVIQRLRNLTDRGKKKYKTFRKTSQNSLIGRAATRRRRVNTIRNRTTTPNPPELNIS